MVKSYSKVYIHLHKYLCKFYILSSLLIHAVLEAVFMKKFASVSLRATPANVRKTSKNVSLPLLILTAKFVPESTWNTFNAKFVW